MSNFPSSKAETLFFQARERPVGQRPDFLRNACGDDVELFREVAALLEAEHGDDDLFDNGIGLSETIAPMSATTGSRIGRYKLLQQLGEGGFGVVYMAEQLEPVNRQVAVKIIKPGMDSQAVIARFEAERQALAMMDHPHIAKVLDGGTTPEGRPYFVMELVRGVSITEFCDKRRLASKERLGLLVDVCHAVQHAHQKGIIHRDLKPSNVMITLHDGKPVVKVIDFGVARAIHQKLTDKTLFTQYGQMLGTPQYMSPEQAEMSGLDVDTRSDIYSMGVLMYELLTGSPPLTKEDLQQAGYAEIQRLICHQELQKPSARVSTTAEQQLSNLADDRGMTPEDLKRHFKGELDWVVMKTLEKDRDRRYATASDLAADIERYLNDEVVEARPPSLGYRVGKYARKHRVAVTATAIIFAALVASTIVSSRFAHVARIERTAAEVAEGKAVRLSEEKTAALIEVENQKDALEETNQDLERQLYGYRLRRVEIAREDLRNEETLSRLAECPKPLRDWEWGRLNSIANDVDVVGKIKAWHQSDFLPNSTRFMAIESGKIGFWDAKTLKCVDEIQLSESKLYRDALHSGGKLAAVSTKYGIIVVDLESRTELWKELHLHSGRIDGLAFSHDGTRVASVCLKGELRVWDARNGEKLYAEEGLGELRLVEFSPDDRYLAAGAGQNGPARIWDAATYEFKDEFRLSGKSIHSISFSPDGNRLACGGSGGRFGIRDIPTATMQDIPLPGTDGFTMVRFSPKGNVVAVGSHRSISIVDALTGTLTAKLQNDQKPIWHISFSSDARYLTSRGEHNFRFGSTLVYDLWAADLELGNDQTLAVVKGLPAQYAAPFSPDGKLIAVGGGNRNLEVFDVQTGELRHCLKGHANPLTAVSWSGDGTVLFAHERGGLIVAWDWQRGARHWTTRVRSSNGRFPTPNQWYYGTMALSRDDGFLYVGVAEGEVVQLDSGTGAELQRRRGHNDDVNWVATSRDGRLLASVSADTDVVIWDAATFTKLRTLTGHEGNVSCVAFSPNGKLVATTSSNATTGITRIWNVGTHETVHTLEGSPAWTCAFSTSGNRLFTSGPDSLVVWDVRSGQELQQIAHNASPGVSVSPDGQTVSVAGFDLILRSSAVADPNILRQRQIYREAREIVVTLQEQAARQLEQQELLDAQQNISIAVRRAAKEHIGKTGDDPFRLYQSSWMHLVHPTDNVEPAANDAIRANSLAKNVAEYAMAAGLAYVRTKEHKTAVKLLEPFLDDEYVKTSNGWRGTPVDFRHGILTVLAMANYGLGKEPLAKSLLNEAVKSQKGSKRSDLTDLLREAIATIQPSELETIELSSSIAPDNRL